MTGGFAQATFAQATFVKELQHTLRPISEVKRVPIRVYSNLSFGAGLVAIALSAGCSPERVPQGEPGAPLAGLNHPELASFAAGRKLFDHEFTPEEGLGPAFNDRRCSSCHDLPVLGGAGADNV